MRPYMPTQRYFAHTTGHTFCQATVDKQDGSLSQQFTCDSEATKTLSPAEPRTLTPPATLVSTKMPQLA